jgi:hypothetical protein
MMPTLFKAEAKLAELLKNREAWRTLFIDYHPPYVERLWMQFDTETRLYLHRIHPCEPGEKALFHPHAGPTAVRIVNGRYQMDVGFSEEDDAPPVLMSSIYESGSCYEMSNPDAWHSVSPIGGSSLSIMVSGKPWNRWSPKSDKPLRELTPSEREVLVLDFHLALQLG